MIHGRVNSTIVAVLLGLVTPSFAGFTGFDQFGSGVSSGAAWGDYDADGDLDLAISNLNEQNRLYRNDGAEVFLGLNAAGKGFGGLAWGDFDNDGDLDVAASQNERRTILFRNDGGDIFAEVDTFGEAFRTLSLAWGDYDNDGDLDLALGNGGPNILVENLGDGTFAELSNFSGWGTYSVAWADYDDDGDLDLAVANGNSQPSKLFKNDGSGNFIELDRFGSGNSRGLAWGDYDNDGDLDLAVINYGEQNRLYRNVGGDIFTELLRFGTGVGFDLAWGDYDNDGDLDLAVSSLTSGNKIYVNHGTDFIPPGVIPVGGDAETYALAWGDYDNDGDLDLAVANRGQNKLCRNDEDDGDYIKVRLEGLGPPGYSNKDGIGAKVKIYDAGTTNLRGFREVSAGSGYCSMNSLEAEFGVPAGDTFDVEVTWPVSGGVCLVEDVIPPAVLNVREDCAVTGIDESMEGHESARLVLRLKQNQPNPFRSVTIIPCEIKRCPSTAVGSMSLDVYSITGRHVANLLRSKCQVGVYETHWDGTDRAGNKLPSGVYFCVLRIGELQERRRLELIR
ncbi:CRTAC1 family protein [candidate division TA06 bacterium]|uniref:CRTAC1 family protein n=1 Tax=candidate division TA06 bacterium TaxID=2250710 RepID=A0A523USR1_UNCT6|nr:MAG: CRTAC1 family protein [candidate division TA06 bacterium]